MPERVAHHVLLLALRAHAPEHKGHRSAQQCKDLHLANEARNRKHQHANRAEEDDARRRDPVQAEVELRPGVPAVCLKADPGLGEVLHAVEVPAVGEEENGQEQEREARHRDNGGPLDFERVVVRPAVELEEAHFLFLFPSHLLRVALSRLNQRNDNDILLPPRAARRVRGHVVRRRPPLPLLLPRPHSHREWRANAPTSRIQTSDRSQSATGKSRSSFAARSESKGKEAASLAPAPPSPRVDAPSAPPVRSSPASSD
mmetsp:Transcript_3947/g.9988  ORF Transcript_3947/g.9988 Transcript_3947/m.9988 type:complete len:258 (+) Transcript_3947:860-1633(+)